MTRTGPLPAGFRARALTRLQKCGLSPAGAHQILDGRIVADARDRVALARLLGLTLGPTTPTAEIYDYPGAYAQRFDGIDRGGGE